MLVTLIFVSFSGAASDCSNFGEVVKSLTTGFRDAFLSVKFFCKEIKCLTIPMYITLTLILLNYFVYDAV